MSQTGGVSHLEDLQYIQKHRGLHGLGEFLVLETCIDRGTFSPWDSLKKTKTTAPRIPTWSPTVVLTRRYLA
jgi:hypothetical protein